MMTKIRMLLKDVIMTELEEANKNFPLFHSAHEGMAVLYEEYKECEQELKEVKSLLLTLWNYTIDDDMRSDSISIQELQKRALELTCEAVQVTAMAHKLQDSLEEQEAIKKVGRLRPTFFILCIILKVDF